MLEDLKYSLSRWRPKLYNFYTLRVRPRLPVKLRRLLGRPYGAYVFWRIGPRATSILGPRHRRSRDRIDIDITWNCNPALLSLQPFLPTSAYRGNNDRGTGSPFPHRKP